MMKKYNKFLAALCVVMMASTTVSAQTISTGKAVAIRPTAEAKGYKVSFNQHTQQITLEHQQKNQLILIDKEDVHIQNGVSYISSDVLEQLMKVEQPDTVIEKELTLKTGKYQMPGIFTMPSEKGKFPVAILVHGSGPNDKDETIGGTNVFRDIAYGLAEQGVATYRYDKRTYTYKEEVQKDIGVFNYEEEVIEDVISAVEIIKTMPEVDTTQIYILGHSLGAMSVPMISTQDEGVAGYIMAAGPARNLVDVIIEQVEYLVHLQGLTLQQQAMQIAQVKLDSEIVRKLTHNSQIKELGFMGINNEMWADLNAYDQVAISKTMTEPILILQGGRDYQVTMEDFALWKEALGDKENVMLKEYPDLNHLFVEGKGKSTPEEYYKQGQVDDALILDIANWIKDNKNF